MTTAAAAGDGSQSSKDGPEFKRKLSKREKKAIKKQEKKEKANKDKDGGAGRDGESSVAEKLYTGKLFKTLFIMERLPRNAACFVMPGKCNVKNWLQFTATPLKSRLISLFKLVNNSIVIS